jgi:hypothetical protein
MEPRPKITFLKLVYNLSKINWLFLSALTQSQSHFVYTEPMQRMAPSELRTCLVGKLCFTDYVKCQGICTQRLHGYRKEFLIEFKLRKALPIPSQRGERIVDVYTSSNSKLKGTVA